MGLPSNPFAGAGGVHARLSVGPNSATSTINIFDKAILVRASTFWNDGPVHAAQSQPTQIMWNGRRIPKHQWKTPA